MLTHINRLRSRALTARTIIAGTAAWLCTSGSASIADPGLSTPKPRAQVQITSIQAPPAVLDTVATPQAGADAASFIERLARCGCIVHRSTIITVTDRVASTIDQTEDAAPARTKADAALDSMAVLIPRFNADGSVTLNISMAGMADGSAEDSSQQLSAVRTFRTDSTQLLGSATHVRRGLRTLVFVTVHMPEVGRTPNRGLNLPRTGRTSEG